MPILFRNLFNSEGNIPRRGPKPRASDLEIIALALYQVLLEIESESRFFHRLEREMPELARRVGTRRNYNERRKSTYLLAEKLRKRMAKNMQESSNPENIFVIDSMPIEVCRFARAKNSRSFRENEKSAPSYGFCAAHAQHYFGYKLHVVCSPDGVIDYCEMTPANHADIDLLPEVRETYADCLLLGDTGYLNRDYAMDLFEFAKIELLVPYRRNMKNAPKLPKGFGPIRKRVEVVFSQLVAQFQIRNILAKKQKGLFSRVFYKIFLFTLLQYLNKKAETPLSYVRYTFVA